MTTEQERWQASVGATILQHRGRLGLSQGALAAELLTVSAKVVAEPDNPHDAGAVAVHVDDQLVGYLSRADAPRYLPLVQHLGRRGKVGYCRAHIRGGWTMRTGTRADFGIELQLASAGQQFELLRDDEAASTAATSSATATLASLAEMRDRGLITAADYDAKKADLLARL